ncbi:MAG: GNAT family N-acetyltransferase [Hoeflea sp.]|uniref:GNAT family N-acetyltransferase n=1 Tax=Hoeflea sp. TaxID=1940281 RepID=UPI0032EFE74E
MKGLRRATAADRPRIEAFQHAAYARTEKVIGAQAIPLGWDYGVIMRECEIWLDEREGRIAGVLILRPRKDDLFLESIASDPAIAGAGVGSALMKATLERAAELDMSTVRLITNSRNPAAQWYVKLGFVTDHEEIEDSRIVLHMSMNIDSAEGDSKGEKDDWTA